MINSIFLHLLKEEKEDVQLLHLWEHSVVKYLERLIHKFNLYNEGILINGSTFLDSSVVEIYYPTDSLTENLFDLIKNAVESIPLEIITEELQMIDNEISYIDISREEECLYSGLIYTENDSILNLYKKNSILQLDTVKKFFNTCYDRIVFVTGNLTQLSQSGIQPRKKNIQTNGKTLILRKDFTSFDLSFNIDSIEEYLKVYLLCFIIGMTEDGILQRNYLTYNNKYLGYSQFIQYNSRSHILGLVDSENVNIEDINELFPKKVEENFSHWINGFKTYLGLYVPLSDIARSLVKANISFKTIDLEYLSNTLSTISFEEIKSLYKQSRGEIDVKSES